jgi:3-hydroxybutyryl-CoA dehydratase
MMDRRLLMRSASQLRKGDTETTRARTITEADIVMWCALTGDWFPIHSDAVYAAKSSFGKRIAPGMMVLAFTGGLAVPADTTTVIANYGLDRIRFRSPVFIGDTIHTQLTVEDFKPRDDGTSVVAFDWQVLNQDDRPVCSATLQALMRQTEET